MPTISELFTLAIQRHQAGRLHDAEIAFRQVLAVDPNHADTIFLLGVIAQQAGKYDEAVQCLERVIGLKESDPAVHNHLGGAYQGLHRLPEAIACYQRALQLQPDFAEAYTNLGNAYKDQGKLDEAVACHRRALELSPAIAEAHNNLGAALKDQGKLDEAVACYLRALELKPDLVAAHSNLGSAFMDQGKLDEAAACHRRTIQLKPDYAMAHNNLGNALNELGQNDQAVACYRRALELQPNLAAAHFNLGAHYEQTGDFESAERCWREALRHDRLHARALAGLAKLLRARLPAEEFTALGQLASSPRLALADRAAVHFGIASVSDAQGDYAEAARHMADANSLRLADHWARGQAYDPADHDRLVAAIADVFSPAHFERVRTFGADSERPVFIFGLPRSGTTLTEQILAGHTKVFGAGELQLARMALTSLPQVTMKEATPFECVVALDQQTVGVAARQYLAQLETFDKSALRIVDKMPDNYLQLGFLATLFPKARFIHCRRDLRDVAVSCWMTDFSRIDWSNNVEHIAARFRAYERLMEHWRRVLPLPILDVDYETTVADLEGTARRLIDWCGLDWEPQCLAFHTRRDPVRTASAIQVRQPIYQHAVARWKLYEEPLAGLLAAVSVRGP